MQLVASVVRGLRRSSSGVALGACLALASGFGPPAAHAEVATQAQVETDLTCQCGCGLTVHSCNHLNCGSGIPLKKEIAEQIATGKSREDILSYFEGKYGEKILSSPTARGFNLAAWTVPFIAIALGGLIVGIVLTRWRRGAGTGGGADRPGAPPLRGAQADPELRARLDRELAELERRS
ncbi:MAG: cytochrome c-type biogenesis protein CcmH [Thermodesulfobacteriota bacterium]